MKTKFQILKNDIEKNFEVKDVKIENNTVTVELENPIRLAYLHAIQEHIMNGDWLDNEAPNAVVVGIGKTLAVEFKIK